MIYCESNDPEGIESQITGGALHTAVGPGQTVVALDYNSIDDQILAGKDLASLQR